MRGITAQKTRFDYIVSTLSPEIATEVRDLILKPPTERPYDTLKTQLIKRTAASEQQKLQQLINAEELGDRKPNQLLRRMQLLLGDQVGLTDGDSSFLHELFLQRLPSNVRMVLASTDKTLTLDKLAELADKVMEVATPTVAAIATPIHPFQVLSAGKVVVMLPLILYIDDTSGNKSKQWNKFVKILNPIIFAIIDY